MSHYAVAVFSDDCDFERLLAPYNENDEKYFEFKSVSYDKILSDFKKFKAQNKGWTLEAYINNFNYVQNDDGIWGYWHNPNGYWDWYSLDGKDYLFDIREGVEDYCDTGYYRKNDIEWYPNDTEAASDAADFWETFVGENAEAEPPGMWNRKYFLERYKTKKQYVKEMSRTIPYAFITPDGVWHAPGRVGWFAISDESAEESNKYMKEWDAWIQSDANPYVSLVDCHI